MVGFFREYSDGNTQEVKIVPNHYSGVSPVETSEAVIVHVGGYEISIWSDGVFQVKDQTGDIYVENNFRDIFVNGTPMSFMRG